MTETFHQLRQRLHGTGPGADDAGMSLIEVLVSATIMSVVMALVTTGMLQMYKAFGRSELAQTGQSQTHNTFTKLDREIRYASYVSAPGKVNTTYYVEYKYLDGATVKCVELALTGSGTSMRSSWRASSPSIDTTLGAPLMRACSWS